MSVPPATMSAAQKVALLDAALSTPIPGAYLEGVAQTLGYLDRTEDASLVFFMAELVRLGNDKALQDWRSEWQNLPPSEPMQGGVGRLRKAVQDKEAMRMAWGPQAPQRGS